ncbi:hypothetical protein J7E80_02350 [Arthrobacter sp. ISL-28]|nr:hypothetical protein [Arthrobacter sp. ISL-28]
MTEPKSTMHRNNSKPFLAGAPSPRVAELIFHDPLADSAPEQQAAGSRVPVMSVPGSREPRRVERNRLGEKKPATRADAIEAVSRELELLALRRGRQ